MKLLKLIAVSALVILMLALGSPAYACACGGYDPAGHVAWFNSMPYEFRASATLAAPAGYQWNPYDWTLLPAGA